MIKIISVIALLLLSACKCQEPLTNKEIRQVMETCENLGLDVTVFTASCSNDVTKVACMRKP